MSQASIRDLLAARDADLADVVPRGARAGHEPQDARGAGGGGGLGSCRLRADGLRPLRPRARRAQREDARDGGEGRGAGGRARADGALQDLKGLALRAGVLRAARKEERKLAEGEE